MMNNVEFDREMLQTIRDGAECIALATGGAPNWSRAYQDLADAADRLDAMRARTQILSDERISPEGNK